MFYFEYCPNNLIFRLLYRNTCHQQILASSMGASLLLFRILNTDSWKRFIYGGNTYRESLFGSIGALISDISVIKNNGEHQTGKRTFKWYLMLKLSFWLLKHFEYIILQRSFSICAFHTFSQKKLAETYCIILQSVVASWFIPEN